jgi:hypothetical protein
VWCGGDRQGQHPSENSEKNQQNPARQHTVFGGGEVLAGVCDAQAASWLKWSEELPQSVEQAAVG